jgi:hypothetical protein
MLYKGFASHIQVCGISCLDDRSTFEILSDHGINFKKQQIAETYSGKQFIIFLDDAQYKYEELNFWGQLVKANSLWIPDNIKFIISATHSLSGAKESMVEFGSLPRLSRKDFLLSDDEAFQFLDLADIGLPGKMKSCHILKAVLVKQSGGLIAALRLSVDFLKEEYMYDHKPTETAMLQSCFSNQFLDRMARCFGSGHSLPIGEDFQYLLKRFLVDESYELTKWSMPEDQDPFLSLKKSGLLVELSDTSFGFSSPLAKRYYFRWIFSNRSHLVPSSLSELIRNVISKMSCTVLQISKVLGGFPKGADFQHVFMDGLALCTPSTCAIAPELSKLFPQDPEQTIPGEIDFFLNNNSRRWDIQLHVNPDGVAVLNDRFARPNGKYSSLAVDDYAMIEFSASSATKRTMIVNHPKQIKVFFNDYFTNAQCIFGQDSGIVEIRLAD